MFDHILGIPRKVFRELQAPATVVLTHATLLGKNRDAKVVLHQWLLAGWGMPIGEMFDLEELTKHCQEVGKWSFFLCSVPLKVIVSLSSPFLPCPFDRFP